MCSCVEPEKNASNMVDAIHKASAAGAKMYFAPEMSILIDRDRKRAATRITLEPDSPHIRTLCKAAQSAVVWIHIGSVPVLDEDGSGRFVNRSLVIDGDGDIRGRYDKIHLFDVDLASGESWRESSAYRGGEEPVAVETPIGLMGLTICYDMRFPDLYSAYSKIAVAALSVPAAFTVPTGKAHWHSLLRARAIEAEAFVIAAAQSGQHEDGRQTYGHSLVVDPWGEVVLDMGEGEGLAIVELDLKRLDEVREQIPVHQNRRAISKPVRRY